MTIKVHPEGTARRLDGEFRNISGALADPTTVTLRVTKPTGLTTEYTSVSSPAVVKDSTGKYHCDVNITEGGKWLYEWIGVGVVDAIGAHLFMAEPYDFTLPPP